MQLDSFQAFHSDAKVIQTLGYLSKTITFLPKIWDLKTIPHLSSRSVCEVYYVLKIIILPTLVKVHKI